MYLIAKALQNVHSGNNFDLEVEVENGEGR